MRSLKVGLNSIKMGYSDMATTEFNCFTHIEKFDLQWRCVNCGNKNRTPDGRDAFCDKCHSRFNQLNQLGDIYAEQI